MIQNRRNILYCISLLSILFFSCCTDSSQQTALTPSDAASVLRVTADTDLPGYFTFNGQPMGYTYDLLDAYAQSSGRRLEIVRGETPDLSVYGSLTATLRPGSFPDNYTIIPVYETSYVILATSKKVRSLAGKSLYEQLDGHDIVFTRGFSVTREYDDLHEMLQGAHLAASDRNTFELLEALINNRFDFLICERSEALLGASLIHNIRTVHQFEESVLISMALNHADPEEGRRFTNWLYHFRQGGGASELYALYFEKGITQRIIAGGVKNRPVGATSVYDDIFKQVAQEENLDWRLVSAIAYSESKYNAYLVSPRGARGLMQVMPATARAFDTPVDELMDPEANVRVAVQLIRKIEKSLRFAAGTSQDDRTSIMLACYNAGIGHVTDARRLAGKYGGNPDSWSDVSRYLALKSQPEYARDETVKCGEFKGAGETQKFVNHVIGKYYAYCAQAR